MTCTVKVYYFILFKEEREREREREKDKRQDESGRKRKKKRKKLKCACESSNYVWFCQESLTVFNFFTKRPLSSVT